MRRIAAAVLVVLVATVAMGAWWSMLAGERAAVRATEQAARHEATATAIALRNGGDARAIVALTETSTGSHLLVRDASGRIIAGSASPSASLMTTRLPGADVTVSAEVDSSGLGVARYSHLVTAAAFLVMACSIGGLVLVTRDRRHARAELRRLGQRWDELAASDDLTGLGNRTRLLEDVQTLIARGSRYGNAFGLALLEVPGEPDADQVRAIAELVVAQARSADVCYRIAPNRFVSLLPEQDQTGAALAAERIRNEVAARMGIDIERGVAAFTPWLPCGAADLLVRAELDLGAAALVRDLVPTRTDEPEEAVTPRS